MILAILASGLTASEADAALRSDRLPPEAYLDPVDQQIARTGNGLPGRPYPCSRETTEHGFQVVRSVPTERCVKMLPAQHWRGLWRDDFEGSQFCPEPAKRCEFGIRGDRIWLTKDDRARPSGGLYRVEFIGRRTMYRGFYGHLGMSDHEIIVDRLVSTSTVEAPKPPPTPAEIDAAVKRCVAAGSCFSTADLLKDRPVRK